MRTLRTHSRIFAPAVLLAVAGCDLSVSNPGPVQDETLDLEGSHQALVTGIELSTALAMNMLTFFGADAAKEFTQGGRIHPIKLPPNPGQLDNTEQLPNDTWNRAHQARWVAEDGARRLRETLPSFSGSPLAAKALLFSGYANRMLGENMCEAVADAGGVQPRAAHLEKAEEYFTEAMAVATAAGDATLATAAQAGRASVRLWLGDDAGAAADAAAVPLGFRYQLNYAGNPATQNNWIWYISSNTPYRAHSVWNTFYDGYYTETGDPRVAWITDPAVPTAEFTEVPWYFQQKYTGPTSPVNLSTGREMVLVRAEVLLRQGDWQGALGLINSLRAGIESDATGAPIPPWTATNATEAWTALKRERGIELWLEARRLGDLWRWVDAGTPGEMEDVRDRIRLCFPVALSELQTNPSIPLDHESPTNPLFEG